MSTDDRRDNRTANDGRESQVDADVGTDDIGGQDDRMEYADSANPQPDTGWSAGAVIDDADTPAHPDDKTVAETDAAYEAVHYTGPGRTRKYRGPRSIVILVLVILGIVGLGVYAVIWSDHLRKKNEKIELRVLEERHVMSNWQQRGLEIQQKRYELAFPGEKIAPANNLYRPLSPAEKALYDARIAEYGTQFEPNANQKALIAETTKLLQQFKPVAPATAPATVPT